MTWPAQCLKVAFFISAAMCFGYDVVNCGCWYRPAIFNATLTNMAVTLQDASAKNVPLATVSALMPTLSTLMLFPAFISMGLAVA